MTEQELTPYVFNAPDPRLPLVITKVVADKVMPAKVDIDELIIRLAIKEKRAKNPDKKRKLNVMIEEFKDLRDSL